MEEEKFKKLIRKYKYQVFLFDCPAIFPFSFARHCWFVTSEKGKINRWEVLTERDKKTSFYTYKNRHPPTLSLQKHPWKDRPNFESRLISSIEGLNKSIAQEMIKFIKRNYKEYPFKDSYRLYPGPNSNTFAAWIVNKFPESKFKLPFMAIGRNYPIK